MADDARLAELRGLLRIGVLHALIRSHPDSGALAHTIAAELLPVVSAWAEADREQHAARRAAEELLEAWNYFRGYDVRDELILGYLQRRAAALTPATEEKR